MFIKIGKEGRAAIAALSMEDKRTAVTVLEAARKNLHKQGWVQDSWGETGAGGCLNTLLLRAVGLEDNVVGGTVLAEEMFSANPGLLRVFETALHVEGVGRVVTAIVGFNDCKSTTRAKVVAFIGGLLRYLRRAVRAEEAELAAEVEAEQEEARLQYVYVLRQD